MTLPADVSAGDELTAAEVNSVRDIGYHVDLNAGETINGATLPVAVYIDNSDDEIYACDADDQTKLEFFAFAISNSTDGNVIQLQFTGVVSGFSGLTKGAKYYVQDDQTIGTTIGTYEVYVGRAVSTTEILIDKGTDSSMQYVGNESISATENAGTISSVQDTLTMPVVARFAYLYIDIATVNNGASVQNGRQLIIISRKGITSQLVADETDGNQTRLLFQASLSTNTITVTVTGVTVIDGTHYYTLSGTAYYFR